jgi:hypothetical protein
MSSPFLFARGPFARGFCKRDVVLEHDPQMEGIFANEFLLESGYTHQVIHHGRMTRRRDAFARLAILPY